MKLKRNKFVLAICACIVIAGALLAYNGDFFDESVKQANEIIKIEEICDIHIDYPTLVNKKLEKDVDDYIHSNEQAFIDSVKLLPRPTDGKKYSFSVNTETETWFDIETVHLIIESKTGEDDYERKDAYYHGNTHSDKVVSLKDFLKDDESIKKLSSLSYEYLKEALQNKKLDVDDEVIKALTKSDESNFSSFLFDEKGFVIKFTPSQLSDKITDCVDITIPYYELRGILNKDILKKAGYTDDNQPIKRDLSQFKGKKLIAFTFDDGPSKYTEKLLGVLDKYNARVTFFVVGNRVGSYADTLKREYFMGNQIGSHSYTHANLVKLKDKEIKNEITKTNNAVKKIIGVNPDTIRPPYGSTDTRVKKLCNMPSIMWNVDTLDWKIRDKDKVYKAIIDSAHDGAIVLMHDIYGTTVDAAIAAMDKLSKDGYAFVTVDEMAQLRGVELNKTKSYNSFKPTK